MSSENSTSILQEEDPDILTTALTRFGVRKASTTAKAIIFIVLIIASYLFYKYLEAKACPTSTSVQTGDERTSSSISPDSSSAKRVRRGSTKGTKRRGSSANETQTAQRRGPPLESAARFHEELL
jgi:hypothetical protein